MMMPGIAKAYIEDYGEYVIGGLPDKLTIENVGKEKKKFIDQYGITDSVSMPAFIPFAILFVKEQMEDTIARWIQNICNLQHSFMVTLNNYSSIPPHTIYWRIQEPQPMIQLAMRMKILDGFNESNNCPPIQLINKPFLILAEGLSEVVYKTAISEYAQKTFHTSFRLERLVLIRKNWDLKGGRLVNTFNFPPGHSI
jgi:hypothetical protein